MTIGPHVRVRRRTSTDAILPLSGLSSHVEPVPSLLRDKRPDELVCNVLVAAAEQSFIGLFSRLSVPRSVRRAMHPVHGVKRAVTPKAIKRAGRAMHPVDNAVYGVRRSLNTKRRAPSGGAPGFRHGECPVKHRTSAAAAKCRNR